MDALIQEMAGLSPHGDLAQAWQKQANSQVSVQYLCNRDMFYSLLPPYRVRLSVCCYCRGGWGRGRGQEGGGGCCAEWEGGGQCHIL